MPTRPRIRRHLTLAALALAVVAPAATAADPAWHTVAPPIEDFPNSLGVRFDPLGTAFAAWSDPSIGAGFAVRPSAGAFAAPVAFPTSTGTASAFGFAANGDGVFIGTDTTNVRAAFRSAGPGGAFGAVQTVGGAGLPNVAVNASGQALAVWGPISGGALIAAVRGAGAGTSFATESLAAAGSPQIGLFGFGLPAFDADGSGAVVYTDASGSLQAIARTEAESWSGPTRLNVASATSVGFAVNTAGDAVVVWNEGLTVKASLRPHDGTFGAAQTVASEGGGNVLSASSVAMAADGTPFVALGRSVSGRRICGGSTFQIYTAELARRSGGTWSIISTQEGHSGAVATSPTGDRLAFAWEGFVDPCVVVTTHAIHAQLGTLAGLGADTLLPDQPPGTITDTANTGQSIAIDGAGNAIVTWSATRPATGGGGKLRVVAFDAGSAPPAPPGGGGTPPGGDDTPRVPDFADLLGLRAPVRNIPVDLGTGLPMNVFLTARCTDRRARRCEVNANGVINGSYPAARASAAARRRARTVRFSIALPRVHATIRLGSSARLKLTIRGRALSKAQAALRAHGTVKLTIAMTVNGVRKPKPIVIPLVAKRAARRRG